MKVGSTKVKIKRVDGCIHGFCIGFKDENVKMKIAKWLLYMPDFAATFL